MYMYIYVCMHIYLRIHIFMFLCIYLYLCVCVYLYMHIFTYIHVYLTGGETTHWKSEGEMLLRQQFDWILLQCVVVCCSVLYQVAEKLRTRCCANSLIHVCVSGCSMFQPIAVNQRQRNAAAPTVWFKCVAACCSNVEGEIPLRL